MTIGWSALRWCDICEQSGCSAVHNVPPRVLAGARQDGGLPVTLNILDSDGKTLASGEPLGVLTVNTPGAPGATWSVGSETVKYPVEKKPLARWKPGSQVLSLGSYGCNLRCPWCQNHSISQVGQDDVPWREATPEDVVALAKRLALEDPRMVGVAYTYNEPLVSWEFVRDCGMLVHEAAMSNVLVSAGCVSEEVVQAVAPLPAACPDADLSP